MKEFFGLSISINDVGFLLFTVVFVCFFSLHLLKDAFSLKKLAQERDDAYKLARDGGPAPSILGMAILLLLLFFLPLLFSILYLVFTQPNKQLLDVSFGSLHLWSLGPIFTVMTFLGLQGIWVRVLRKMWWCREKSRLKKKP